VEPSFIGLRGVSMTPATVILPCLGTPFVSQTVLCTCLNPDTLLPHIESAGLTKATSACHRTTATGALGAPLLYEGHRKQNRNLQKPEQKLICL
jgi:hypothetical protein